MIETDNFCARAILSNIAESVGEHLDAVESNINNDALDGAIGDIDQIIEVLLLLKEQVKEGQKV